VEDVSNALLCTKNSSGLTRHSGVMLMIFHCSSFERIFIPLSILFSDVAIYVSSL
jgi:hypothetical protein